MKLKNYLKSSTKIGLAKNSQGFSLIEILIALSIFAVFASAYISTQTSNVNDSSRLEEEMTISRLCENKINEIILNPPDLRESLTLSKETKTFEEDEYKDYEYIIEYKRFKIPDMTKLNENQNQDAKTQAGQSMVMNTIKKNLEEMIWQVSLTVRNKTNDTKYSLSTWLLNPEAKVSIQ
jgi:type II secretion system protein I